MAKGLSALAGYKTRRRRFKDEDEAIEAAVREAGGVVDIPTDAIVPHPLNPRKDFTREELEELARSLGQGQIRPIIVKDNGDGTYTLIGGERRWRAATELLGWPTIQAVVKEFGDENEEIDWLVGDNVQVELSYAERADFVRLLIEEKGWSENAVATLPLGGRQMVRDYMLLFRLPEKIQDAIREAGNVGVGVVRVINAIVSHGEHTHRKVISLIKKGRALKEFEALLHKLEAEAEKPRRKNAPRAIFSVGETPVAVMRATHKGAKLEIECPREIIEALGERIGDLLAEHQSTIEKWIKDNTTKKEKKSK